MDPTTPTTSGSAEHTWQSSSKPNTTPHNFLRQLPADLPKSPISPKSLENSQDYIQKASSNNSHISAIGILKSLGKGVRGILGGALVFAGGTGMIATKGAHKLSQLVVCVVKNVVGGALGVIGAGLTLPLALVVGLLVYLFSSKNLSSSMGIGFTIPISLGVAGYWLGSKPIAAFGGAAGSIIAAPNYIGRMIYKLGMKIFPTNKFKDEATRFEKLMKVRVKKDQNKTKQPSASTEDTKHNKSSETKDSSKRRSTSLDLSSLESTPSDSTSSNSLDF